MKKILLDEKLVDNKQKYYIRHHSTQAVPVLEDFDNHKQLGK